MTVRNGLSVQACGRRHPPVGACRLAQLAGREIHLVDEGRGPPVILVHGSQSWAWGWRRQIPALAAAGHRAVALDLPGNGWSAPAPFAQTVAGGADLLRELLDQLGEERATFVGSSAAGLPLLELALRHPERVGSLVLSATCGVPHREPLLWRLARVPGVGEAMGLFLSRTMVRANLREAFFDPRRVTEEDVDAYLLPLRRPGAWRANVLSERRTDPAFVEAGLDRMGVPALVVWGEDDPWHPVAMAREFGARLPGARVEILARCGHLPQDEQPDLFNRLLLGWLEGHAGDAAAAPR